MPYIVKGKNLNEIDFIEYYKKSRNKCEIYCDNIMCFDTEVSSGYIPPDTDIVESYDSTKGAEYYTTCQKVSLVYVWTFSIDDNIFMGRTLEDFVEFLQDLEDAEPYIKIVYVHNLGYDFQFLRNVLQFTKVFAREKRKPIYAQWETYYFRCSYILTRQSLDSWAKNEKLPIKKLVGDLDYNKMRTPKTALNNEEIDYCIHDVLVMYYGLQKYRAKYDHVADIPLTQTGEVRKVIREKMNVKEEYKYRKNCINLIPDTLEDYDFLVKAFCGGYTHSNSVHTGHIIENVKCKDIASSYPTVMCLEKYPMTPFQRTIPLDKYFNNDKYSFIIDVTFTNIHSKRWNTFLSLSKCLEISRDYRVDNGRVISASMARVIMTNIDYEIFLQCYNFDDKVVNDFKVSINDYLSPTFVKYILELYRDKTELKGIDEYAEKYAISKQYINSMYGMMVTKTIIGDIALTDNGWIEKPLTSADYDKHISIERKKLSSTFTAFQFGVWVTAYARRNLWRGILALDYDVVYCDTDSIKHIGEHEDFFEKYNADIEKRENERAKMLGIDPYFFAPKDTKGSAHRLGIYDTENTCDKFKTLGAKKYISEYADARGDARLKMTVAGVRKGAVSQLNSIDDFNTNLVFDEEHAKKLLSCYNDNIPKCVWCRGADDEYISNYRYGITLQPTTYHMSVTPEYAILLVLNARRECKQFETKTKIL